ncbi:MAG: MGMT family protein [Clostridiaceae bacterium]|nr:MGMT family protein [Clostridiaceae bacterium]
MKNYFQQVYEIVAQIPKGKIATYGQIAAMLGTPKNARIVGYAMNAAPAEMKLPCHRVLNKKGALSPAYAFGDKAIQHALLEVEGITFDNENCVNVKKHLWDCVLTSPAQI